VAGRQNKIVKTFTIVEVVDGCMGSIRLLSLLLCMLEKFHENIFKDKMQTLSSLTVRESFRI
jgi:hypothetical protein